MTTVKLLLDTVQTFTVAVMKVPECETRQGLHTGHCLDPVWDLNAATGLIFHWGLHRVGL